MPLTVKEKRFAHCIDCGVDTFVTREWYMVHDALWQSVITSEDPVTRVFLCVLCLEDRLGRQLCSSDFMDPAEAKINRHEIGRKNERLLSRLNVTR